VADIATEEAILAHDGHETLVAKVITPFSSITQILVGVFGRARVLSCLTPPTSDRD